MSYAKSVLGLVDTSMQAEAIVASLRASGIPTSDISALFPDKSGTRDFAHEQHTKAPEGAVIGVSAGGVTGGALGLLVGMGALAIPGLGALIAAGPILAALTGAAAGAAAGGLAGALIGLGVPEIQAKAYEGKIRGGNILLSVHVEDTDRRDLVKKVFENGGARDISVVGEASVKREDRVEAHR